MLHMVRRFQGSGLCLLLIISVDSVSQSSHLLCQNTEGLTLQRNKRLYVTQLDEPRSAWQHPHRNVQTADFLSVFTPDRSFISDHF